MGPTDPLADPVADPTALPARRLRLALPADAGGGEVSALHLEPPDCRALLVLGHGAGAGMEHPFLEALARRLAARGVATLRYQFPATEAGRRFPDPPPVRRATVRAAVGLGRELALETGLPLLAGGKSMGGRMTSEAAAEGAPGAAGSAPAAAAEGSAAGLPGVAGLVFVGFPLHPAGKPGTGRAEHLAAVPHPMLFLQGTRDKLADLDLLRPVVGGLGDRAMLHVVDGADHGFEVLKRSGRTGEEVVEELAGAVAAWQEGVRPGVSLTSGEGHAHSLQSS